VPDLSVRNADAVTAGDRYTADIGIQGSVIVAIAAALPAAKSEIDAAERWLTPGGVDAHCHLDQPMSDARGDGRRFCHRHALGRAGAARPRSLPWPVRFAGSRCGRRSMTAIDAQPARH
jgi:dihydropyrimidinase